MTATQILALVGLWRRTANGGTDAMGIFADDVAIEVSTTSGLTFGRTRAENCLCQLMLQDLVKQGSWQSSYRLTKKGQKVCEALKSMGLKEDWP